MHYYNGVGKKPITAAFSMSEYENAEFARRKGSKDKTKRKSKGGMIAGIGAGVAGLGAAGAAGVRYGGAEMKARKAASQYSTKSVSDAIRKTGGAKGQLNKDIDQIKRGAERFGKDAKIGYMKAKNSMKTGFGMGKAKGGGKGIGATLKGVGEAVRQTWKSGAVGKAGLVGAGLGAAGVAGGAAYGASRLMSRKKDKKR